MTARHLALAVAALAAAALATPALAQGPCAADAQQLCQGILPGAGASTPASSPTPTGSLQRAGRT